MQTVVFIDTDALHECGPDIKINFAKYAKHFCNFFVNASVVALPIFPFLDYTPTRPYPALFTRKPTD